MNKILLIGGGGHCEAVIDTIISSYNIYDEIAIIDRPEKYGETICGIKVIGEDSDLEKLYKSGYKEAFITLGSVGNPSRRIDIYKEIKKIGFTIPVLKDSSACVSNFATVHEGTYIGKNAVVNVNADIQVGAIINTSAIIEHDCKIGKFVHIAPGGVVCGNCTIGDDTHIGANATLIQGICIGANVLIGAGTVVIRNIENRGVVVGNPGRRIR